MKTVGVNRAPIRIRPSGRARDSGRNTFTKKKKKKQMKNKQKELNEHPETGSDPLIKLDRKGVLHSMCLSFNLKIPWAREITIRL